MSANASIAIRIGLAAAAWIAIGAWVSGCRDYDRQYGIDYDVGSRTTGLGMSIVPGTGKPSLKLGIRDIDWTSANRDIPAAFR